MDNRRLRLIAIISIIIIALGMISLVIWLTISNNTGRPAGVDGTTIQNYDQKVKNLSNGRKINIEEALFNIVKENGADPTKIKDAAIRDGSDIQTADNETQFSGSFIVDIPSIQQSYKISYLYSKTNDGYDSGYPVVASCVDAVDVVYDSFSCKDTTSWEKPNDVLIEKLPHKTAYYTITGSEVEDKKFIVVKIMVNTNSARTRQFFQNYKTDAQNWLLSQGVDLSGYSIEYRNILDQVVR